MTGLSPSIQAREDNRFKKEFAKQKPIIKAVQDHMFPKQSNIPSAHSMQAIEFLLQTIAHKSYDKDIRTFILEGARELNRREKGKFLSMSKEKKEKSLRAYEETEYGRVWLSRIMTLTMEALFSDPIYGSNMQEKGWRALDAYGGYPRPKTRYLEDV